MRFSRSAFCAVWLGVLCAVASALAQQRPLDNGSEAFFDSIDSRLFVDVLPPRIESDSALPRLADLLPQAPLFTEQRESLFQLDFNGYDLEANPHRLVYLEPTALSLVSDDREGQALRIQTREPVVAGITRSLDPDRLAGQLIELSARVKLDGPFTVPPDALAWYGPVIQLRWERPHPDPAQRSQGENLREWRTIFDSLDGLRRPATFFPDSRFHTYRTRLSVPDDLTGAVLQVVVQNAMATMVVDDLSLSLVETRENRLLREAAARTTGNLIGPGAGFELGLTRGAVTTERLLSPAPGGTSGRDFGDYQVVTDAAEGRAALAVTAQAGLSAALEMPWLGLAAGQPYAFSVWLRAARDGVKAAFGVTDGDWRILGTPVTLTTRWKRYAATFSPRRTHQQAHWPWVSIDAPESDVTVFVDGLQLERGAAPGAYQQPAPVELAVTDNFAPGPGLRHVYPEGQPMAVVGRLLSHGREPITVRLRAVLESHSGRLYRAVLDLPEEVVLPPEQLAEVPLHEGPLPRGLYRFWLVASHTGTGEVFRAEQVVAVLPAPRAERLGFHDGPGRAERTAAVALAAKSVGAAMVSTEGTPTTDWREHWTDSSTYDWSLFDTLVGQWRSHGIGILHTVGPRLSAWPNWVMERYGQQFGVPRAGTERMLPPRALWAAYLRDLSSRYAGKIDAYQILGAPDLDLQPDEYLALLQSAHEVLASSDPEALVVGPGSVRLASAEPGGFVERLLDLGAGELLDAVAVELNAPYPEALDAARDNLRRLARQHRLELWDTGHGYAEAPLSTERLNPRGDLSAARQPFSPQSYDGAAFVARHELLLAAAGFRRSFLAASVAEVGYLHDPIGPVIEADGSPRSSLAALAVLSAEVGPAPAIGEWRWDLSLPGPAAEYNYARPQGVRAVAFATGQGRCLLAWWTWQRDATLTVTFPAAAQARLFVVTGEAVESPADGRLMLTHSPLYLADLPQAALAELGLLELAGRRPECLVLDPPANS